VRTPNCERPENLVLEDPVLVAILSLFNVGAFGAASGLDQVFVESAITNSVKRFEAMDVPVFSKIIISVFTRSLRRMAFGLEKKTLKKERKVRIIRKA
jgi:type II secretory pathway component PulJ